MLEKHVHEALMPDTLHKTVTSLTWGAEPCRNAGCLSGTALPEQCSPAPGPANPGAPWRRGCQPALTAGPECLSSCLGTVKGLDIPAALLEAFW
jgi:hypothetical protein